MVPDVQQMVCQIREGIRQLLNPSAFKAHIIGGHTDIPRNIRAKLLRQSPTRVCSWLRQKLPVHQRAALSLAPVQRVLERDLRVRPRSDVPGDRRLDRFKIQKIQRIGELPEELPNLLPIHIVRALPHTVLQLPELLLIGDALRSNQIRKGNQTLPIKIDLLFDGKAVQVEDRRLGQMPGAVAPEGTYIGVIASLRKIDWRLRFRVGQEALCQGKIRFDVRKFRFHGLRGVCDPEELLRSQGPVENVFPVQDHQIGSSHMDAAAL